MRKMREIRVILMTLAVGCLFFAGYRPAGAVPVFARKYQTSCQTCHTIFPKLNPFGEAFRLNGYRLPGETEEQIKEKPVSLGSEGYKKTWPSNVWPGEIPGNVPLAMNVKMASIYASSRDDSGRQVTRNDFQFPQEVNIFSAGTLGEHFSYFGELTWSQLPDGGTETEIEHAQIHVNSPFGPEHLFNFKIGKFSPDLEDGFQEMWLMADNGVDSLFAYSPIGFNGGSAIDEEAGGISLPASVTGVEMYGVGMHRLFYTLGAANGVGPSTNGNFDGNTKKDYYARVDYKFGGMGLDGDTTGVTLPPENWRENSLRVGAFGYWGDGSHTQYDITDEAGNPFLQDDRYFQRYGGYLSWTMRDLNVFGVYMKGTDTLRTFDPDSMKRLFEHSPKFDTWFAQADYVFTPVFQGSVRYEKLNPGDPAAPNLDFLNVNFSVLVRANIKTMLEYRRDLQDKTNHQFAAVLRFAY
jgi:hypothetical protein